VTGPGRARSPGGLAVLTPRERALLKVLGRRRRLPAGVLIFGEGDVGGDFYLVETGLVRVFYHLLTGREPTIGYCSAGDLFGLAELSANGRRVASAETVEASVVWAIATSQLGQITRRLPALSLRIIEAVSLRLRSVTLLMESVVTLPVRLRVANFLLGHAEHAGVRPESTRRRWTHEDIADMLGCTRQTVTETLGELARSGLIRVARRRVIVVDPYGLERLLRSAAEPEPRVLHRGAR
jgi:CRP-like cAMP-binding protein